MRRAISSGVPPSPSQVGSHVDTANQGARIGGDGTVPPIMEIPVPSVGVQALALVKSSAHWIPSIGSSTDHEGREFWLLAGLGDGRDDKIEDAAVPSQLLTSNALQFKCASLLPPLLCPFAPAICIHGCILRCTLTTHTSMAPPRPHPGRTPSRAGQELSRPHRIFLPFRFAPLDAILRLSPTKLARLSN